MNRITSEDKARSSGWEGRPQRLPCVSAREFLSGPTDFSGVLKNMATVCANCRRPTVFTAARYSHHSHHTFKDHKISFRGLCFCWVAAKKYGFLLHLPALDRSTDIKSYVRLCTLLTHFPSGRVNYFWFGYLIWQNLCKLTNTNHLQPNRSS